MKVLLDTNLILDYILKRSEFFEASSSIFKKAFDKSISAYISASSITDIFYLVSKAKNRDFAIEFIKEMLQFINVAGIDRDIILRALYSDFTDFEDAVQNYTAENHEIKFIITRNEKDYEKSNLNIITPEQFIENNYLDNYIFHCCPIKRLKQ